MSGQIPGRGVHRVMGLETEYGVLAPGHPRANATVLSAQVVNAYAELIRAGGQGGLAGARWDYAEESPLLDARGWRLDRSVADPSLLTNEGRELTAEEVALIDARPGDTLGETSGGPEHVVMNLVLGNGARLYVDHAHPEYSSPETTNPLDAVLWDQAGDAVALAAARHVNAEAGEERLLLYKNNTDNKGVSYGAHENYLVPRGVPFEDLARGLLPFFATRQVFCGSGRVGRGITGRVPGFQVSQRADFFEAEVGLETTVRRPLVNTRDEPHADADRWRRLHVIAGDANLGQVSTYLRVGTTAVVLALIEAGAAPEVTLRDPVRAVQSVSHDPSLRATVELSDGRRLTALDIQEQYCSAAAVLCSREGIDDLMTQDVLERWQATIDGLRADVSSQAATVDWVAKLSLMNQFRERDGLTWEDARIALMDLQWADLRPERGLFRRLEARGRVERLLSPERIGYAVTHPPEDTRAYFRGRALTRYRENVVGANWDSVVFGVSGRGSLARLRFPDPLTGTLATSGSVFDAELEIEDFLAACLGEGKQQHSARNTRDGE